MPIESVFPRLEALLPLVSASRSSTSGASSTPRSRTGTTRNVRWALMYPDAYEVGLPNQGVMILYEVLNEQPDVLAERTYAVWPDLEALMREHGDPAVHRRRAPTGRGLRPARRQLHHRARLHEHAHRARPRGHPARRATDRTDEHPIVIAGGHAAFNPEPIAEFIDAAVLGDGEQAVLEITDVVRRGRPRAVPAAATSCCSGSRRPAGSTSRSSTTSSTCPTAASAASRPTARASRGGSPSTPSWTSTRGPTPSSRSCRSPRPSTSGCPSRSSAAAPAAAGSARPA